MGVVSIDEIKAHKALIKRGNDIIFALSLHNEIYIQPKSLHIRAIIEAADYLLWTDDQIITVHTDESLSWAINSIQLERLKSEVAFIIESGPMPFYDESGDMHQ